MAKKWQTMLSQWAQALFALVYFATLAIKTLISRKFICARVVKNPPFSA
jgi:hypothetical protein